MCPDCEKKVSFKKSLIIFGAVGLTLWGIEGFASGTQDHNKMDHSKMDHSKMSKGNRKALSEDAKKSVLTALDANDALHGAFFKYDAKSVETNAQKLIKAIDAIKDEVISKLLKFSKTKLSEIKASSDREANNKNYHLVSMALIHIVNKYDVGAKYNAYSCPMVKKKWIQNSEKMAKVHNPYAPNMPHCGSQDTHH